MTGARFAGDADTPPASCAEPTVAGTVTRVPPTLLRQTLAYLPAQLVGPLAQAVAALVWTHWLAPAPYGILTFLIAGQELVFLASLSWWTQYTMRYLGGLDAAEREAFARSEAPVVAIGFLAQVAGTWLVLLLLGQPVTSGLAVAATAYIATRSLLMHLGERARAQGRIAIYTFGQFASSVVGFVFALALVATVAATPTFVLWGFSVAQLAGILVMWRALGMSVGGRAPRGALLAAAMRYGGPLLVAGGFAWVAQNGIRVVVGDGAGAAALGLIAVGWGLGQRLATTLAMLVVAASFPRAVQSLHGGSKADAYRQLAEGGVMLMGLTVPASVGLCFLAQPFAEIFVAAPFREATIAVLPYAAAAGAIRNIRIHVADPVFLLTEQPRFNTAMNAADSIVMVAGCFFGLLFGGLVGAAAGSLVATCLSTIGGFVLAARAAGFRFPWAPALRIAAASAIMALALYAAAHWSLAPAARLVAEVALGVSIYAAALAALFPAMVRALLGSPFRESRGSGLV